jgi:prenyltransferase/squalene oxidase-like repeat protein
MSTRKGWPVALSLMFVGSTAVIVRADEVPSPAQTATPGTPTTSKTEEARKPVKPKELSDSVKKGLAYLISQQHETGGFGQGGGWRVNVEGQSGRVEGTDVKDPPDVGNTCIAALALIRAGNTPKDGQYAKQVAKAIDFIEQHVEAADKESLYVTPVRDTQLQSKIGKYVDTFLTALVLSELKGQMPDKKSEDRLFAALNKTIGKIESNQQADGTFVGNVGWASVLSQGICSKALNRASQKGFAVKAETIKRDLDQTVGQLDPSKTPVGSAAPVATAGSISSGRVSGFKTGGAASGKGDAGVSLYSLSANAGRLQDSVNTSKSQKRKAEAVLSSPSADAKSKEAAQQELKDVAAAENVNALAVREVAANLGNDRFLKGFGNNGGEEFLSYMNISETLFAQGGEAWEKWDRQAGETITKVQNGDGSWSGHHCITGRTFCTSTALLTMLADRAPLPVAEVKPEAK